MGFAPVLVHYLLMGAVSMTVVGAFESVGAILVVAMLVVPPAAAYLLTDRLGVLLPLAVALGVASAIGGYLLAHAWDASIAGAMATVAGLLFTVAFLASPRHGLAARLLTHRRLAGRLAGRLLLLHLAEGGRPVPLAMIEQRFGWRRERLRRVLSGLAGAGWAHVTAAGVELTDAGAAEVERSGEAALAHPLAG
jgi:manganese/zinc/iron transport system permease protein